MVTSPSTVVECIVEAQNDHDLEGMLEWFAPDYETKTPVHPERNFTAVSASGQSVPVASSRLLLAETQ
jgi:hypothetical protein